MSELTDYIDRTLKQMWVVRCCEAFGWMAPDPNPFPRISLFRSPRRSTT